MHFCWLLLLHMHQPMLVLQSPEHEADVLEPLLDFMTPTWLAAAVLKRFEDSSIWEYLLVPITALPELRMG